MEPLVIAHRGCSAEAPENTMAAFRLGWEAGADGVECDVHLTADGEVVCIHDFDTLRVSGTKKVIARSSGEELSQLEAGAWKDPKFNGEPIPRLRDLLAASPEGSTMVIELKCGPEIVGPLLRVLDDSGIDLERVIAISFVDSTVLELKRSRPGIKAYWLSALKWLDSGEPSPAIQEIVDTVKRLGVDGFGGQSGPGMRRELIAALEAEGFESNVWTVDDPAEARRMREIGLTSITTNDPRATRAALSLA